MKSINQKIVLLHIHESDNTHIDKIKIFKMRSYLCDKKDRVCLWGRGIWSHSLGKGHMTHRNGRGCFGKQIVHKLAPQTCSNSNIAYYSIICNCIYNSFYLFPRYSSGLECHSISKNYFTLLLLAISHFILCSKECYNLHVVCFVGNFIWL